MKEKLSYMDDVREGYMKLSEYLDGVREVLEDAFGAPEWVVCEIASVSWSKGHCYLELVENDQMGSMVAKARGTIWSSRARVLAPVFEEKTGGTLRAGIKVLLNVMVSYSTVWGFSLNVIGIDPSYTLGDMEAQRIATLKRLEKEGLMEKNKELAIPVLPCRIALVSAEGAAGYGDFLKHLKDSGIGFKVELFETQMQGAEAPDGISKAFERINICSREFDVVVFIRGGGSNLDLACFDDYLVARAIAMCNLPVISGIGHERDNHICDDVAAVRVKTPTGAADFLIEMFAAAAEELDSLTERLSEAVREILEETKSRLDSISLRISSVIGNYVESRFEKLSDIKFRLLSAMRERLSSDERVLEMLSQRFSGADPSRILEKGYGIILIDGEKVSEIESIKEGGRVRIVMKDGEAEFTVNNVEIKKKEK